MLPKSSPTRVAPICLLAPLTVWALRRAASMSPSSNPKLIDIAQQDILDELVIFAVERDQLSNHGQVQRRRRWKRRRRLRRASARQRHPSLQGFGQHRGPHRLADHVVHAGIEAADSVFFGDACGKRDDWQLLFVRRLANPLRGLEAVDQWHVAVHEHDVVVLGFRFIECLPTVGRDVHLARELSQERLGHHAAGRVVFGDEHQRALAYECLGPAVGLDDPQGSVLAESQVELGPKASTLVDCAADPQLATHELHQLFADCQAQSVASRASVRAAVASLVAGEDSLERLLWNTDTRIAHRKANSGLLRAVYKLRPNLYRARVGELDRVVHQVEQHLADAAAVSLEPLARDFQRLRFEANTLRLGAWLHEVDDSVDDRPHVERRVVELDLTLLKL